jgi:hypothetical protein
MFVLHNTWSPHTQQEYKKLKHYLFYFSIFSHGTQPKLLIYGLGTTLWHTKLLVKLQKSYHSSCGTSTYFNHFLNCQYRLHHHKELHIPPKHYDMQQQLLHFLFIWLHCWGHWKPKEETLDHTLWRTNFGKCHGPVTRQTMEWWTTAERGRSSFQAPFSFTLNLWETPKTQ